MRRDRTYPGASKFRDRHGKWRWRARAKGKPTVMLPGDYGSHEFVEAWNAWANGTPVEIGARRTIPGSISALIAGYYQSSDFKTLAEATQTTYRGVLERFRAKNGDKPVRTLTPEAIRAKLDKMAATPRSANVLLQCLRVICRFAVDRAMLKVNPAAQVKRLKFKSEGFHTWTDDEVLQFEQQHPVGTKARLALDLLLYMAPRRADVVKLGRQHERDGVFVMRQQKTGTSLIIPVFPALRASIDAMPKDGLTYLTTAYGRPFTPAGFGNWFRDRCDEAGLPHCSAHGLRKAAARRMAEAGKSAHEIMSVTGHRTLSEAERYTRAVDQERLARRAVDGLAGMKTEPIAGKLDDRFANSDANLLKLKG